MFRNRYEFEMMRHREDCFGDDAVLREILDSRGERRGDRKWNSDFPYFFGVIPGARLSRTPSLSGPLTHLCDLEAGYRGDGLQSWCGSTRI